MKKLFIDTTSNKEITVGLFIDEQKYFVKKILTSHKAQIVLPMIVELLKKHNVNLQNIDAIEVNPGPGSFTGVRVGVSVANALGYSLGIPVNGKRFKKDSSLVEPEYV